MAAMNSDDTTPRRRKRGRRSPLASVALVLTGLLITGGAYALFTAATPASASVDMSSAQTIEQGKKLFASNCATCHGLNLTGTGAGLRICRVKRRDRKTLFQILRNRSGLRDHKIVMCQGRNAMSPPVTCAPWKPVVRKNAEP